MLGFSCCCYPCTVHTHTNKQTSICPKSSNTFYLVTKFYPRHCCCWLSFVYLFVYLNVLLIFIFFFICTLRSLSLSLSHSLARNNLCNRSLDAVYVIFKIAILAPIASKLQKIWCVVCVVCVSMCVCVCEKTTIDIRIKCINWLEYSEFWLLSLVVSCVCVCVNNIHLSSIFLGSFVWSCFNISTDLQSNRLHVMNSLGWITSALCTHNGGGGGTVCIRTPNFLRTHQFNKKN